MWRNGKLFILWLGFTVAITIAKSFPSSQRSDIIVSAATKNRNITRERTRRIFRIVPDHDGLFPCTRSHPSARFCPPRINTTSTNHANINRNSFVSGYISSLPQNVLYRVSFASRSLKPTPSLSLSPPPPLPSPKGTFSSDLGPFSGYPRYLQSPGGKTVFETSPINIIVKHAKGSRRMV